MSNQQQRNAQEVIECQSEAICGLMRLKNHSTVRMNPTLRCLVDQVYQRTVEANAIACVVWFASDTLSDVEEFLPFPPAA